MVPGSDWGKYSWSNICGIERVTDCDSNHFGGPCPNQLDGYNTYMTYKGSQSIKENHNCNTVPDPLNKGCKAFYDVQGKVDAIEWKWIVSQGPTA